MSRCKGESCRSLDDANSRDCSTCMNDSSRIPPDKSPKESRKGPRDASKSLKGSSLDAMSTTFSIWMQHDVFPHASLKELLHSPISTARSSRGVHEYTLTDLLLNAIANQEKGVALGGAVHFVDIQCIVPRERTTRWDIRLTDHWVRTMKGANLAPELVTW